MTPLILRWRYALLLAGILILAALPAQATPQRVGPVEVELVARTTTLQPGTLLEVGLRLKPDEHWHVYWKNPGDAGLPPTLKWSLPEGFAAGEIHWPAPSLIESGPLAAYGYHGEALYPVTIKTPESLVPGTTVQLRVKANWLVCKEACLPGDAELSLTLPVAAEDPASDQRNAALFTKAEQLQPKPFPPDWSAQAVLDRHSIYLDLQPARSLEAPVSAELFAPEKGVIEYAAEQTISEADGLYRMQLTRSPYSTEPPESLKGVLALTEGTSTHYYELSIPFGANAATAVAAASTDSSLSIWPALLFAFTGGLILNLMPCVLPVLSIKVLGLIGQANEGRRSALKHGWLFTLGVIVTFWAIVGTMLILQAGGAQLGWGFQLQSPTFVMILAAFMFLFALSLFGVFEISLFGSNAAGLAKKAGGAGGAFVSGITATLVATPCTAPFMGAALGYTLTQPPAISLLIYSVLGLGMASPYLLLSGFPALLRFVPKPGRWMETFKQAMGFLLAATVIWLAWLLSSLAGSTALVVLLGVLLLTAIAAWIYGRWGSVLSIAPVRWSSRVISLALIIASLLVGHSTIKAFGAAPDENSESTAHDGIAWQKYSSAYLDELLAQEKTVFIDFTASWCLSCQVNERVALSSSEVQDRFEELGIVPLIADWTHRSEDIAKALAGFGRNSVPLYVLYPAGRSESPILLPEILTPGIVLEALDNIENN